MTFHSKKRIVHCMELGIGARLKRWRLYRALTLKQLAAASGLHASSLHRIEHGQQEPKHSDLESIARALGLRAVADFYAFTPPEPSDEIDAAWVDPGA